MGTEERLGRPAVACCGKSGAIKEWRARGVRGKHDIKCLHALFRSLVFLELGYVEIHETSQANYLTFRSASRAVRCKGK